MSGTRIQTSRREIAARLEHARRDNGLSQETLARRACIDRKTVNRIENNHFSPSLDTFLRLCRALSIKPSNLLENIK